VAAPFAVGGTGIVVRVPESEPVVADLRGRYDAAARWGMPAHVTVLYPWLAASRITATELSTLRLLAAGTHPFDAELSSIGRFPQTLYLEPTPAPRFTALTEAVWALWPEAPPYRGRFDSVVPHLTVADAQPLDVLDSLASQIQPGLPLAFAVEALSLYLFDGLRWVEQDRFPLGAGG